MARLAVLALARPGGARCRLALRPDPAGATPGFARGGGFALSHLERELPPRVRLHALELGKALGRLGPTPRPLAEVEDALAAQLRRLDADATLAAQVRLDASQLVPRFAATARRALGIDPELAAVALGLRRLVKKEGLAPEAAAEEEARLAAAGLAITRVGHVVLGAVDPSTLATAAAAERALGPGPEGDEAARALGALLGYPPCCVEAFTTLAARDDLHLFAALLPPGSTAPAETSWLLGPLALVSHAPCEPTCPATLDLARTLLTAEGADATSWSSLARRLQAIDRHGSAWALATEGETVTRATRLSEDGSPEEAPDLAGATLTHEGLTLHAGPLTADLWIDHRPPAGA